MAIDKRNLEIEASHVRMEDLVSNMNFLRNFINVIGQGAAQVDMDFMMRVGKEGIPNSRAKKRQAPEEIFSGWSQWRRSLFTRLMDKLELRRIYEDMGYDLTYLKE